MALRKRKIVISAEPRQVESVVRLVREGRYASPSQFVRDAIDEKLERLRRERLARQIARYCADGHAEEDREIIDAQAPPEDDW